MNDSFRDRDRERDRESVQSGRSSPPAALVASVVVGVLALIFVLTNRDDVKISVFGADFVMKEWVVIVVSIVIGVLLDRLVSYWWRRKRT